MVFSWPALLTFAAAAGCLSLSGLAWQYRERLGGRLFALVGGLMTLTALINGVSFLLFDPLFREFAEILFTVVGTWALIAWLAFAVVYTGRGHLLGSWSFRSVVAGGVFVSALFVTNPLHGLMWVDFAVVSTFGAAGATSIHGPGMDLVTVFVLFLIVMPTLLLLETHLSYGRLYRIQTTALIVTPLFLVVALGAYLFDLGPVPELNLIGLSLLPHMLLDIYALYWGDLFAFTPAIRRLGENAAIDDLGTPVLIGNTDNRLVALNRRAEAVFGLDSYDALGADIDTLIDGASLSEQLDGGQFTLKADTDWREFSLTRTPLRDATDHHIGYTITLHDITDQVQREQQLEVLTRILRHNLRNDLNVVAGYADVIEKRSDDPRVISLSQTIGNTSWKLIGLGEKARIIDEVLASDDRSHDAVSVSTLLYDTVDTFADEWPRKAVVVESTSEAPITVDRQLLSVALEAAVENGLEHNNAPVPTVRLHAETTDTETRIRVRDNGPGIPQHERDVLDVGTETDLQHGSGLGQWLISWCVRQAGGRVSFEVDEGTTVCIEIPHA